MEDRYNDLDFYKKYRIIHDYEDPYKPDTFKVEVEVKGETKEEYYLALTKKNSDFMEAVIGLDSNYGLDMDINKEGSTANIFNRIKTGQGDYKELINKLVTAIDKANSTRMSELERIELANRLLDHYKNKDELINALKKELKEDDSSHIFSILMDKAEVGKKANQKEANKKYRYNISFASKFCSYGYSYLGDHNDNNLYSKYDGVVSDSLLTYACFYLDKPIDQLPPKYMLKFEPEGFNKGYYGIDDPFKVRIKIYLTYVKLIEEILKSKKINFKMNKDQLDHIIWYGKKSR